MKMVVEDRYNNDIAYIPEKKEHFLLSPAKIAII
jgi:hypothetical protein